MTTPTPPTSRVTPITVNRQALVNEAVNSAEYLLNVLRGYRAARRDRFPMSHLARIESVLEQTTNAVFDMTATERSELVATGAAADEEDRLRLAAAWPRRAAGSRPEPTLPTSALLRTIKTADLD